MGYKEKKIKTHAKEKLFSSMMKKTRKKEEEKNIAMLSKIKFKEREIIQQGVQISISSTFHTLAHLDQIV
jgi:uncharacterized protein YaaR (DUF327 family)